ncbi:MAG: UDP-N-acetylglucosamine 2-epimerase (non-hydrolyzing) [Armatimonadetes bacterium]|nr:UDP-N-acetylglucosamine 2-epimerase (non-hydrolyzing) [Armatimonadota bacterium]
MLRVLTVVGARPQFIKAAAVSRAFVRVGGIEEQIVHTGQHYDDAMSEQFFRELDIPSPAVNLDVGSASHGAQTGRMLEGIEAEIAARKPDRVLIYGDTNSTLAGALAAVKLHVPVAHVEAGLRSFNRAMPEEINRIVSDHVSDVLFAPTKTAVRNLAAEGIRGDKVLDVGDVMYDAALFAGSGNGPDIGFEPGTYVVATVHRAENTDDPAKLTAILEGLAAAGRPVVLPMHPRTKNILQERGRWDWAQATFRILEPLGYRDMAALVAHAGVVATDSGGLQKEAFFHRVPCVTLRTETEWTETVELGWNTVQPPISSDAVGRAVSDAFGTAGSDGSPYGDGHAAEKIALALAGTPVGAPA